MLKSYPCSIYHVHHARRYQVSIMANSMEEALIKLKLHYPTNRDYSGHCVFNPDHMLKG
jgi:hypothetical protein